MAIRKEQRDARRFPENAPVAHMRDGVFARLISATRTGRTRDEAPGDRESASSGDGSMIADPSPS
jgi:hypothetical protein